MRLESALSDSHQVVECRREAGHRDVGHRRLREASRAGGETQRRGLEVEGMRRSHPAREQRISFEQSGRHRRQGDAAVTAQPLVAARDDRVGPPPLCVYLEDACCLGRVDDQPCAFTCARLAQPGNVNHGPGGELDRADRDDGCTAVDAVDDSVREVLAGDVVDEAERAVVLSRIANPGTGNGREVCRHGDNGAAGTGADQEGKLTEQLTGACRNGEFVVAAVQESRATPAQRLEESGLFLIGHPEIAVTGGVVEEVMHRLHSRLADETQRSLVEIGIVLEAGIVRTIDERVDHEAIISSSEPRPMSLPSRLIPHRHRPRAELQPAHELQVDTLRQPREQRRPMARYPGLHDELVLIDQSQLRQRLREPHASHEQSLARLPLEPLNGLPQIAAHELRVPIDPLQAARHDVLLGRVDRPGEGFHPGFHPIRPRPRLRRRPPGCLHHLVRHPAKQEGIGPVEVLGRVTMQLFVREHFAMIAAPVQGDVDGVPKGSHH